MKVSYHFLLHLLLRFLLFHLQHDYDEVDFAVLLRSELAVEVRCSASGLDVPGLWREGRQLNYSCGGKKIVKVDLFEGMRFKVCRKISVTVRVPKRMEGSITQMSNYC